MHTIKWVSEHLGLPAGTLRAWEQRYGIVHPNRSDVGYRLYDDADVDTLRRMAGLVAGGMLPAQAAQEARAAGAVSWAGVTSARAEPSGLPEPGALVAASRTYDARALERTLDAAFAAASFEHVVDVWLIEAMAAIGDAWASGGLDISQEHFISAAVMRRLAAAFDAAGHTRAGRHVVAGLAPGATHEIATIAFATMLRRAGLRVTYLGADLPVSSWVEAVLAMRPDAVVVGAPRAADGGAAAAVVRALEEAAPGLPVFVGGPGAPAGHTLQGATLAEASDSLATRLSQV